MYNEAINRGGRVTDFVKRDKVYTNEFNNNFSMQNENPFENKVQEVKQTSVSVDLLGDGSGNDVMENPFESKQQSNNNNTGFENFDPFNTGNVTTTNNNTGGGDFGFASFGGFSNSNTNNNNNNAFGSFGNNNNNQSAPGSFWGNNNSFGNPVNNKPQEAPVNNQVTVQPKPQNDLNIFEESTNKPQPNDNFFDILDADDANQSQALKSNSKITDDICIDLLQGTENPTTTNNTNKFPQNNQILQDQNNNVEKRGSNLQYLEMLDENGAPKLNMTMLMQRQQQMLNSMQGNNANVNTNVQQNQNFNNNNINNEFKLHNELITEPKGGYQTIRYEMPKNEIEYKNEPFSNIGDDLVFGIKK